MKMIVRFDRHYILVGLIACFFQNSLMCSESALKRTKTESVNQADEYIELMRKKNYVKAKELLEKAFIHGDSVENILSRTITNASICIELSKLSKLASIQQASDPKVLQAVASKLDILIGSMNKLRNLSSNRGKHLIEVVLKTAEYCKSLPDVAQAIESFKKLKEAGLLTLPLNIDEAALPDLFQECAALTAGIGLDGALRVINLVPETGEWRELKCLEDLNAGIKFIGNHVDWKNSNQDEIRYSLERAFNLNYEESVKLMWVHLRSAGWSKELPGWSKELLGYTLRLFHEACLLKRVGLVKFFLLNVADELDVKIDLDGISKQSQGFFSWLFGRSKEEKQEMPSNSDFLATAIAKAKEDKQAIIQEFADFLDGAIERVEDGRKNNRNPLEIALTHGDEQLIGFLVIARANLKTALDLWALRYGDICSFQRWNPVHLAAWLNKPQAVKIALSAQDTPGNQKGAMVSCFDRAAQDVRGRTAFHLAVMQGNVDVINALFDLKHSQLAYAIDKDGVTALGLSVIREVEEKKNSLVRNMLDYASEELKGDERLLRQALLKAFLDIEDNTKALVHGGMVSVETVVKRRKPLHIAAQMGNETAVRLMVAKSWLLDEPRNLLQERDGYGRMPIHYAVESGNLGMVNLLTLIDGSANVHRDRSGNTPLHLAAGGKKREIFDRLVVLSSIDDLCYETSDGKTVLHVAIETKLADESIIEVFKKFPLLCDKPDSEGRTPLYLAVLYGNKVLVDYLLGVKPESEERKANIRVAAFTKGDGDTALHLTARLGDENISKAVITAAHGTDLYFKDKAGKSPIHHAVENNKEKVVALLQGKSPGSIWVIDDKKETPLHKAARLGYSKVAKQLLDVALWKVALDFFATTFFITDTAIERLINEENFEGQTALHVAVQRCEEVIQKRDYEGDDAFKLLEVLCSYSKVDKSKTKLDKYDKTAEDYAHRTDVILLLGGYKDKAEALNTVVEKVSEGADKIVKTAERAGDAGLKAVESIPGKAVGKLG